MTTLSAVAGLIALLIGIMAVACGSNPNEHVQSNEFFRPAAERESEQQAAADATSQAQEDQSDSDAPDGGTGEVERQSEADQGADVQEQAVAQDEQQASDDQAQTDDEQPQATDDAAPLETSDDIIRRYSSPSYGYSFELVCSPFCDPNSNGIDRVSFLSETGRALIGVDVLEDDGADSEALLRSTLSLTDNVQFSAREETAIVTGEAAERFAWEEDRRATGGFQARWHVLLVRAQGVVIILRAGAVLDDYEELAPALERTLSSFILPLEITARPGHYDRFEFVIAYDTADIAQEFGQPTTNPPSAEAGLFVLQSATALKAILIWQVLGQAFYDGDTAIQQSLQESLGIENVTGQRDWGEVDGQPARTGETEVPFGEGLMKVQSFAWYCQDGGREFTLHVLDPDDPESVALPLIESFRCSAEQNPGEADEDSQ